ncbi:MAG: HAD family hydrolase [Ignavibacteriales bacterium]
MFDAILFDLDGTLLDIDMNHFLPKYFGQMIQLAADKGLEHQGLPERVYRSTEAMLVNKDPRLTNREIFERDFWLDDVFPRHMFLPFFEEFYETRFDKLQAYAKPLPCTQGIISKVFGLGTKVVIATNSVFPDKAILKRLNWAGVGGFDYSLVTSYEVMHFTKPHPEYYEEILEVLGLRPERCLMVGNDVGEDMVAGRIGMKTFLVQDRLINDKQLPIEVDWMGTQTALLEFLNGLA